MSSGNFVSGNRSVGLNQFHFEWCPKYRNDAMESANVVNLLEQSIINTAQQYKIIIHSMHVVPDHVHLFVGNCRKYSVPDLVQHFKGYSSRIIRAQLWSAISKLLWGKRFWSEGYFYESVGMVTSAAVKFYIERQQGKHWQHEYFEVRAAQRSQSQ